MSDRLTLPASVVEDARAHPEKYRPEVESGDRALAFWSKSPGRVGTVLSRFEKDGREGIAIEAADGSESTSLFGWLRVGGVEQGPRPEVGGQVIALSVHLPEDFDAPGMVGTVDFVGYDAIDRLGPLVVFPDPHGIEQRTRVTEWAILPEDDGMGEATAAAEDGADDLFGSISTALFNDDRLWYRFTDRYAHLGGPTEARRAIAMVAANVARGNEGKRTVGSLNADDIGRWIEVDAERGITGSVTTPDARHGRIVSYKVHIVFEIMVAVNLELDTGRSVTWAADTPCRVSDGPGETT